MNSYGTAQAMSASSAKPRWWQNRRVGAVVMLVVLIAASLALVGTPDETLLLALDGNSGRAQWSMPAPVGVNEKEIGIPVAANGRLYVSVVTPPASNMLLPRYRWELRSLDAATGALKWTFTPESGTFGTLAAEITAAFAPVATADTVYVSLINLDYQAWLVALDAQTGQVKWQQPNLYFSDASFKGLTGMILDTQHYAKFGVAGDKVYALLRVETTASDDKLLALKLTALDAHTGKTLWSSDLAVDASTPDIVMNVVVANERHVYVTTDKTAVFDAQTGTPQATEDAALIVISDDAIYRRSEKALTVTERTTDQHRWQFAFPADLGCSGIAVGTQNVYLFCTQIQQDKMDDSSDEDKSQDKWENFLVALDVRTGTERWRKPIAENLFTILTQTPATMGDRVAVVGGALGELRVMTFTAEGEAAWSYHLRYSYDQATSDGSRVYVVDTRPRWRGWLAWINPAWR